MRSHWGDGAGLCSELYSGRVRGWPKMEKEDDPTGQKEKINIIGRSFPERVWNPFLWVSKSSLL